MKTILMVLICIYMDNTLYNILDKALGRDLYDD